MSTGLPFPYHEKVEQKFETTSSHYSGASNTKFLLKNVYEEKNTIIIITIIIIIVYQLPLVPTLFEVLWDEENTLSSSL